MKKFITTVAMVVALLSSTVSASAQMINQTNLEDYAKRAYGEKWEIAANQAMSQHDLDAQGNIVYQKVIEVPGLSKDDLYIEMANWFVCNYDNSLQFADKEQGVLIARPYLRDITSYKGGFNAYNISINPSVRAQVKDGKVLVTYTLGDYDVEEVSGGGNTATAIAIGVAATAVTAAAIDDHNASKHTTRHEYHSFGPHHYNVHVVERTYRPHTHLSDAVLASCISTAMIKNQAKNAKTWAIANCYPFTSKDKHKKTSSKAFIMSNVYSQVVMNNIEAALNQCTLAYNF